MAVYSSILAWEIPRTEEPGRLQSMGWQTVGYNWSNWAQLSILSRRLPCYINFRPQDTWIYPAFFPKCLLYTWQLFHLFVYWLEVEVYLNPKSHLFIQPLRVLPASAHSLRSCCPLPPTPNTHTYQSLCPGSLSSYSQPDWHLRPGCSGVNNACLLVLRLPEYAPQLPVLMLHSLFFGSQRVALVTLSQALTLLDFSITSYHWWCLLHHRCISMYVWRRCTHSSYSPTLGHHKEISKVLY